MEVSGQLHAPAALAAGKEPLVLIGQEAGCGRGDEKKNSPPLPGLEPPIIQSVVQRYTTELSLLLMKLNVQLETKISLHQNLINCGEN
jgi:hypothetical protein